MCFRSWNRPRGSPDVRNEIRPIQRSKEDPVPGISQKADGIRSHLSIVESVIPLSLKGFTIHSQAFSLKMGPEKGIVALEMPAVETLDALFHPSQCARRYARLSVRQAYAFLTRQTTTEHILLFTNCERMQRFQSIQDIFEPRADSPICWKRQ